MCESSAYLIQNGKEELILENVEELYTEGNTVKIINLFGDQKIIDAEIKQISFVDNKIILEKRHITPTPS
ncbi:MAG: CooT family nickel-binding protein [Thermodesulfobacteriota bacterium]|nr:CooT family nickel-binding protein [Thermodesulfobacteriota bacterium]